MTAERLEILPGVRLDARRAAWLADHRALLLADLHLGYAWVERQRGRLFPLIRDDVAARLASLVADYQPAVVALLGDVLHARVGLDAVRAELDAVLAAVPDAAELVWIAGNHDRGHGRLPAWRGGPLLLVEEHVLGPHVFTHGDAATWAGLSARLGDGGMVFMGHEHPAVRLGDGVATGVKAPAFLVGERLVVLPAFSDWAAGVTVGDAPPLSRLLAGAGPMQAVAILGKRLLPLPGPSG